MADFLCSFVEPSVPPAMLILCLPLGDPTDIGAVLMPYTALIDLVPPTAILVSPPLGDVLPHTPIVVEVTDNKKLARCFAWVEYSGRPAETIFARGVFMPDYSTSTVEEVIPEVKRRFTFRRNLGWPSPPFVWIEGVDIDGNVST